MRGRGAHVGGSLRGAPGFGLGRVGVVDGRERAMRVARGLAGRVLPAVTLSDYEGWPVRLSDAGLGAFVVYVFPGVASSPDGQDESANGDAAQHRAFDRHCDDFDALGVRVVGLSSETPVTQRERLVRHRVGHTLWGDPELRLARALGLPTFTHESVECYRRLMFVACERRIIRAFFPVESPERSACQVISWMKATGR